MKPLAWLGAEVLNAAQRFVGSLVDIADGLLRHPHTVLVTLAVLGYPTGALDFQSTVFLLLAAIYGALVEGAGR